MQKPISRQELYETLVGLGLFPLVGGEHAQGARRRRRSARRWSSIAVRIRGMASEVLRAYGGREAIEIARREMPDLIVLDLMMPEVSGFDVVDALSADARDGCAFRSSSSPPSRSRPKSERG